MFGMLDYRAHKLYVVLLYPLAYLLTFLTFFVPTTAAYFCGLWVTKDPVFLPVAVFFAWLIFSIPWGLLTKLLLAIPTAIFNFLIDPIPADGRTKDQALAVVAGGEDAILGLKFDRPATEWTDNDIIALSRISLTSRIYQDRIQRRLFKIREFYEENPHVLQSVHQTDAILKEWEITPPWSELIITNAYYRIVLIQFIVLILLTFIGPR